MKFLQATLLNQTVMTKASLKVFGSSSDFRQLHGSQNVSEIITNEHCLEAFTSQQVLD